jgi:hypothetical protein
MGAMRPGPAGIVPPVCEMLSVSMGRDAEGTHFAARLEASTDLATSDDGERELGSHGRLIAPRLFPVDDHAQTVGVTKQFPVDLGSFSGRCRSEDLSGRFFPGCDGNSLSREARIGGSEDNADDQDQRDRDEHYQFG